MANKITFLFGAGASANALPVVNKIPSSLTEFRDLYHDNRSGLEVILEGGVVQKEAENSFVRECDKIIELLVKKQHASVDTYAKRLRLTAPYDSNAIRKYRGLKAILSSFFITKQFKSPVDYRYDSFLASILGNSHTDFPEHVRIITWNYDYQLELAFSMYSGKNTVSENQSLLRVNEIGRTDVDSNQFSIFKLNGTTNFIKKNNGIDEVKYVYDSFSPPNDRDLCLKFTTLYNNVINDADNVRSSLSFAWESGWGNDTQEFLEKTENAIKDTNTLVVIGYSFPFFNRNVDKRLISAMGTSLKKVYIQDRNAGNVATNFASVLPAHFSYGTIPDPEVIKKTWVDQFFLPPEL